MNGEDVILEGRRRAPQAPLQSSDLADPALEPLPVHFTTRQLADYLGYRGRHAQTSAQRFIQRNHLPRKWRSARCVLVRRADVDAVLTGMRVRHAGNSGGGPRGKSS